MLSRKRVTMGAWATIEWTDEPGEWERYLSFSDPDHWESDPEERDEFGVPDDEVFYYTTLAELWSGAVSDEFRVLQYELVRG